jgi:hypothetical protein
VTPKITEFAFLDDLHLMRRRKGEGVLFIVSKEFRCVFTMDGHIWYVTVLPGYRTDLASIPIIVPKWIAQKIGPHIEAAVIHDWICTHKLFSSDIGAAIFNEGMRVSNVPTWRRQAMYRSVKSLGPQWKSKRQ